MQPVKLFGTIGLIFITGIASFTDENLSETLQCVTPIAYNISLRIQNTHLNVISSVDINFTCTQQNIRLHINRYCDIQTLQVIPEPDILSNSFPLQWKTRSIEKIYFTENHFKPVDISFIEKYRTSFKVKDNDTEQIIITLYDGIKIPPGKYSIQSNYNCSLEKVATVSTFITKLQNQPEKKEFMILPCIPTRWIFPYMENPAIKAKFSIQITHSNTVTALSNIGHKKKKTHTENVKIVVFNSRSQISTHIVTVSIIPTIYYVFPKKYISVDKFSIINRQQATTSITYARSLIQNINSLIKNVWNNATLHNVTYLIVPVNVTNYETIVNTELVIFREADIIYDKNIESIIKQNKVTCLIVRSVTQEMFSNWVITIRPSDLWFTEGFLTVYGVYIYDQFHRTSLLKSSVVQTRRIFFDYTEALLKYNLSSQDTSFISSNYILGKLWQEKAFSTFYMLSTIFEQGLLYTYTFAEALHVYYNTTPNTYNKQSLLDKFWNSDYEEVLNSKRLYQQKIAKDIITSWTARVGYPVVQVIQHNSTSNTTQNLNITVIDCIDVDHTNSCSNKWWIPVSFYKVTTTDIISSYQYYLSPTDTLPLLPVLMENEFAIVVNSSGYRVNYDRQSWRNITLFLENSKMTSADLSDVTLAQIFDDAFYFLVQNTIYNEPSVSSYTDLDIYFDIASSLFRVDKSYIVWYPLLFALENLSKYFLYPLSDISRHIKDKLLAILNKFLDNIDMLYDIYSVENSVSNHLYHEVLKWTCILGGLKCNDHVNTTLEWHIKNPERNKFLPSWQKWLYCQGLVVENVTFETSAIWNTLLKIHTKQSKKIGLLEFLPCSRVNSNIEISVSACINFFLPSHGLLFNETESDTVAILFNMFAKHSRNVKSLSSILHVIDEKRRRNINIAAILNCIINNIYSDEGLLMITDEKFLEILMDLHHMPYFLLHAIVVKVKHRRNFLFKMQFT